jgi:glucosamine 6-phosphate synthetase-like amidotransferase/phosphosugar isomerase protein
MTDKIDDDGEHDDAHAARIAASDIMIKVGAFKQAASTMAYLAERLGAPRLAKEIGSDTQKDFQIILKAIEAISKLIKEDDRT